MPHPPSQTPPLEPYDRKILGIGAGVGLVFLVVPPFPWLLSPLVTLFHELGHAVVYWAFGYVAIPAFDFLWGGGVTAAMARPGLLMLGAHVALAALLYWLWTSHRAFFVPAVAFGMLYLVFFWTDGHQTLVGLAGHLATLTLAGVFLYRAWRGALGDRPLGELERALYVASGLFVYGQELAFAWGLVTSEDARLLYRHSPKGINDLIAVSYDLGLSQLATYRLYLFVSLLAPILLLLVLKLRPPSEDRLKPRERPERRSIDSLPDVWDGGEE